MKLLLPLVLPEMAVSRTASSQVSAWLPCPALRLVMSPSAS
jgi:hypothetical protein